VRLAWAIIALLAMPVPASGNALGISASFLHAQQATLDADLTVLDWNTAQDIPPVAILKIHSSDLMLQTDSVEYLQAGEVAVGMTPPSTTHDSFQDASVRVAPSQGDVGLYVTPLGTASIQASYHALDVQLPQQACQLQPLYFERNQEAVCAKLDQSAVTQSQATSWNVTGTFMVGLWGWSATITSPTKSAHAWSGSNSSAPPTSVSAGPTELRYLTFRVNGSMLIDAPPGPMLGASHWQVEASTTSIQTPAGTLQLTNGSLALSRNQGPIQVDLQSGILTNPDGSTTIIAAGSDRNKWFPWLMLGVVAAMPAATLASRRHVARAHGRNARDNIAIGNFHAAARHARHASRHAHMRIEGRILAAIALIRANELDQAQAVIDELEPIGAEPASAQYLAACVAAKRGLHDDARRLLRGAIDANAKYADEAAANPILEGVRP
jgi:hypothetical protein